MERILRWATAGVLVTALFATAYVLMQQVERQGADDGPTRLASQVASQLRAGNPLAESSATSVRLDDSQAEFYIVYDRHDRAVSGDGILGGDLAEVPAGLIDAARHSSSSHGVTWQPRPGLRFATDTASVGSRVVVAGESLAPTEHRIDQLGLLVLAAWLATIFVLVIAFAADEGLRRSAAVRPEGRESSTLG